MNTTMTICGNVVDDPKRREFGDGQEVVNFRIASTPRRFDRKQGCFVDGTTLFVSVSAWRQLGRNVFDSVRKGQPVVVTGRFTMRQWTVDGQPRSAYDLDADAVGHDLSRGTTQFTKVYANAQIVAVEHDLDGLPKDETENYYNALDRLATADGTSVELDDEKAEREPAFAAG